ncbi:MAG: deoxyguanosinetriphosphate triphosphohydrolase [Candidatus Omnitrophica bacterium]|nr:deoxyguanosinetriphosphate triphosphohydrolase [Candidatus Omnitrophota bacterium]
MKIRTREEIEKWEDSNLASYAMHSKDSKGRKFQEPEHQYRTIYQRDRDRIVHCEAFRKLEYKTQVFMIFEGDYYRTRLTHTLEVAQIARTIGRNLGLNEDLIEAIALAHDLGHAPFGHAGEEALQEIMKDSGGFNHNLHGYRIVTDLEKRYLNYNGLNLTYEVKEGIVKHKTGFDVPSRVPEFRSNEQPTLEAQIVDIADEIAYYNHDLDDGLTSDLINLRDLEKVPLWDNAYKKIKKDYTKDDKDMLKYHLIRELINQQVDDLLRESLKEIEKTGINSSEDVRKLDHRIISFSIALQRERDLVRDFLMKNLYQNVRVVRMTSKAKRFIHELFKIYSENPRQLPEVVFTRMHKKSDDEKKQIICDYIASMTDRAVLDEYKKLFEPYEKV